MRKRYLALCRTVGGSKSQEVSPTASVFWCLLVFDWLWLQQFFSFSIHACEKGTNDTHPPFKICVFCWSRGPKKSIASLASHRFAHDAAQKPHAHALQFFVSVLWFQQEIIHYSFTAWIQSNLDSKSGFRYHHH